MWQRSVRCSDKQHKHIHLIRRTRIQRLNIRAVHPGLDEDTSCVEIIMFGVTPESAFLRREEGFAYYYYTMPHKCDAQ
jgi:hypothetical protein